MKSSMTLSLARSFERGDQADQERPVGGVGVDLARVEGGQPLRMVLHGQERHVLERELLDDVAHGALGRRARDDGHALAGQVRELVDAGGGRHEQAAAVEEGQQREVHLRHAGERLRRRAALDVHGAVGDGGDAILRGDLGPLDVELRQRELLLDAVGDAQAEIDRVSLRHRRRRPRRRTAPTSRCSRW